jgi:hypothetical protein
VTGLTRTDLLRLGIAAAMGQLPPSALPEPLRPLVEHAVLTGLTALLDEMGYQRVEVRVPEGVPATGLLDLGRRTGQIGQ